MFKTAFQNNLKINGLLARSKARKMN